MTLSKHLQLALALTYVPACVPRRARMLAEMLSGQEFCAYGSRG